MVRKVLRYIMEYVKILKRDVCEFKEFKLYSNGKVYSVYNLKCIISILILCMWPKTHLQKDFF